MAKPLPVPVLKGRDADEFHERTRKPRAPRSVKELYRGAMAELAQAEAEGRSEPQS